MANPRRPEADRQEQLVERHPRHQDPTRLDEERTSDNSTVDNGGVGSGAQQDRHRENGDPALRTEM